MKTRSTSAPQGRTASLHVRSVEHRLQAARMMRALAHVLCPIDFSDYSPTVVAHAAALARAAGASLTLQHVVLSPRDMAVLPFDAAERARREAGLRRLLAGHPDPDAVSVRVTDAFDVHRAIVGLAETLPAGVIVMGSHGRSGFERLWLGSVTEKVLRTAPCPVLVIPRAARGEPDRLPRWGRVLCAVDFSTASVDALQHAVSVAGDARGELTVVYVIDVPPELRAHASPGGIDVEQVRAAAHAGALRHLHTWIRDHAPEIPSTQALVREGAVHREILKLAGERQADLIVMGASGHGALDRLAFGSNTARVARGTRCPLLVIRP